MERNKLEQLAGVNDKVCVSISMNTHRTHPDNAQDVVRLKSLLKEAKDRVLNEFDKNTITELLARFDSFEQQIDVNYSLDSLHIFLSNSAEEIVKSPWPVKNDSVSISESFALRPLIMALNRTEEYMILLLSQSGVKCLHALNDKVIEEINNEDFPFDENSHQIHDRERVSDSKFADNLVREYLNKVDKAAVRMHNKTGMSFVVICTEDNYSRLMQVADRPSLYLGHVPISYNNTANHTVADDAWKIIKDIQKLKRAEAVKEMQEAIGHGKVITDLPDIFKAVKEGRGDLLIVNNDFRQPVKMTGEFTFDLADDVTKPDVIDDLTSNIAWDIVSKKGRAVFVSTEEKESLEDIVLKVRY